MKTTKIPEANVLYNDLKGTAAADVADWNNNSLDNYLSCKSSEYDTNVYTCIGCEVHGVEKMGITFYCRNMQNDKVVPITLDEELTMNDLGNIFKRLNIVLFTEQIAEIEENTITLHVNM